MKAQGANLMPWLLWAAVLMRAFPACGQLLLLPDIAPQQVFATKAQNVAVSWRNAGEKAVEADLCTRLHQTSSATTTPIGEAPWKKLKLLGRQTVVESATLDFPAVKAETRFVIQWVEAAKVLGTTEVLVYPPDLLQALKPLAGDEPLGVF